MSFRSQHSSSFTYTSLFPRWEPSLCTHFLVAFSHVFHLFPTSLHPYPFLCITPHLSTIPLSCSSLASLFQHYLHCLTSPHNSTSHVLLPIYIFSIPSLHMPYIYHPSISFPCPLQFFYPPWIPHAFHSHLRHLIPSAFYSHLRHLLSTQYPSFLPLCTLQPPYKFIFPIDPLISNLLSLHPNIFYFLTLLYYNMSYLWSIGGNIVDSRLCRINPPSASIYRLTKSGQPTSLFQSTDQVTSVDLHNWPLYNRLSHI